VSPADAALFRLGTFSAAGALPFAGIILGEEVYAVADILALGRELGLRLHGTDSVLALLEHWEENFPSLCRLAGALPRSSAVHRPLAQLRMHAPLLPRQVFQAGANYHKHVVDLIVDGALARDATTDRERVRANASEMMRQRAKSGAPFVFTGLPSSIIGPDDPIVIPYDVQQPDWELELTAVIGRPARRVSHQKALEFVAGFTIANDITARDRVARPDAPQMGMDWMASKGAPTFLPIGPWITPAEFSGDPQRLRIILKLNGQVMQDESTADMIFSVARLIEFVSQHVQLLPGDLVLTGSPSGNGAHYNRYLQEGDLLEGEITGLGRLRNPCIAERQSGLQGAS